MSMKPWNGTRPVGWSGRILLNLVAVDRLQKQAGSNPLVQVLALLPERFQLLAGLELFGQARALNQRTCGAVATPLFGASDGLDQNLAR